MSKNKTFTGPLAEHIQRFLNEKRSLGYKYEEQERVLYVLDQMSKQFDCSNGLPKNLCLAFIERDPNWRQKTQEQRVTLIRTFAEYLIRHETPAYLVDFSIVTNRHEDFKPYIFTHSQIKDIFNAADSIRPHSSNSHIFYPAILRSQYGCGLRIVINSKFIRCVPPFSLLFWINNGGSQPQPPGSSACTHACISGIIRCK